jgi:HD-GYP domain-containing protein (c-di-GMP phosphodiesterase class II)
MGLSQARTEQLRQAALLHDIGKIGISERLLHKQGKLSSPEYEVIKTHAVIGGEFLETSEGLGHLAGAVRYHHERWDGSGYPDGLRGEAIPLEARILAVCDSVEAMASDRPYRRGLTFAEVVAEVKRCMGTQFDPQVARAFIRLADRQGQALIANSATEVTTERAACEGVNDPRISWFVAREPDRHLVTVG